MQLNEYTTEFANHQVNVAAISYDAFDKNQAFTEERSLNYELLSDQDAATVLAFGILNEQYAQGHPAYGIPHPGVVFVDETGKIVFKRAKEGYKLRPNLDEMVAAVADVVSANE